MQPSVCNATVFFISAKISRIAVEVLRRFVHWMERAKSIAVEAFFFTAKKGVNRVYAAYSAISLLLLFSAV